MHSIGAGAERVPVSRASQDRTRAGAASRCVSTARPACACRGLDRTARLGRPRTEALGLDKQYRTYFTVSSY